MLNLRRGKERKHGHGKGPQGDRSLCCPSMSEQSMYAVACRVEQQHLGRKQDSSCRQMYLVPALLHTTKALTRFVLFSPSRLSVVCLFQQTRPRGRRHGGLGAGALAPGAERDPQLPAERYRGAGVRRTSRLWVGGGGGGLTFGAVHSISCPRTSIAGTLQPAEQSWRACRTGF